MKGIRRTAPPDGPIIPPAVSVQPSDPIVTMMIQGLQKDLSRARAKEEELTNQRFVDVQTIARLSSELDDAEQRATQCAEELRFSRRLENDQKQELIELRLKVSQLTQQLNDYLKESKQ